MPQADAPSPIFADILRDAHFRAMDVARRAQAAALTALGLGPVECAYRVCASGACWRLREYADGGGAATALIIAAPIKRPYIWDLSPAASAIRRILDSGVRLYMLEWLPPEPARSEDGFDEYADRAIEACIAIVAERSGGIPPFVMGHSLGGTLAAMFATLHPDAVRGLVVLSAPLCFQPGSSPFRDALVRLLPALLPQTGIVPGSLLSQVSALAAPDAFIWSRVVDAVLSLGDPAVRDIQARIERWALDEVALPGRLVRQIVDWLYRENRFCAGTLRIGSHDIGPANLRVPLLAIVNTADAVAPRTAMAPFVEASAAGDKQIIDYAGEAGTGLQHLAVMVGPQARATVWPRIIAWMNAR